ncbi:Coenzyme F420 hydrogenase/dehydrogenase, beta subunit C-terminal domain [Campylobacter geochelonis]|uniref:4Fe-4S ferredoxin iron-sulfur binding domain-containing protein n=1 Tax=Campylobacter geochelonis TaxID=1780362 RepID=A0A128EKJ1_9BACT|nr:Coenzyme F420 hydrogenase/dehydrogenase, beta subunit C-terminal domain [Campylobacter geochelonis]QKF71219.1 coenzyme F420 hydrogenase/dehydrogenase, beta subunit family protein [Campylobacter geochelonis]CZE48858.1 4Fe-4S ferredoxin iron-sulfur binding domain-containing protein [Campylobacter geochelonis]
MKPNVIEAVVKKDRCIGCGACAGLCPASVLKMKFNSSGIYEPMEIPGCLEKCKICLDACPFFDKELEEKNISQELYGDNPKNFKELGNFINTYSFCLKENNERIKSASGGAGYYILSQLLSKDEVDKIIAVEPNEDPEYLFKFAVFSNKEELKNSRSSAYYPVTMEEVIKFVLKNNHRYAIVTLPCFAKALRFAQKTNYKLRNRVKYIIGLVCGQIKTKHFAQTLGNLSFKDEKALKKVDFRFKVENRPSSNFAFKFTSTDDWSSTDDRKTSPSLFWGSRAFTPFACNNCNDTFALCCDAVLMDAWLPEFTKDWRGHSLVITREKTIDEIFKNSSEICEVYDYKRVYLSQKQVVENKQMFYYKKAHFYEKRLYEAKLKVQEKSNKDKEKILYTIEEYAKELKRYQLFTLPYRATRKIYRIIRSKI